MEPQRYDEKEDSRGWGMGCCAPNLFRQDELAGFQVGRSLDDRDVSLTFDQPQRVPAPSFEPQDPRPATSQSFGRTKSWFNNPRTRSSELVRTKGSRSSSISILSRPWTSQSRSRPSIGPPMNFRRVTEPMPTRRRSFRPLELSIYLPTGRISPLPDFNNEEWTSKLPQLQRPEAALVRRETLDNSDLSGNQNVIRRKPLTILTSNPYRASEPVILAENGPGPTLQHDIFNTESFPDLAPINEDRTPTLVPFQLEEEAAPRSRPWSSRSNGVSSPLRMRSPSPFTSRSRSNADLSRKPSLRRSKTETAVDDAIRELNTIVEERRVKAMLGALSDTDSVPTSPTTHIPAIAPSMKLRARSETLSDIGSAFAAPNKSLPAVPVSSIAPEYTNATVTSPHSSMISMSTARPRVPVSTQHVGPRISTKTRLSTWLKRSLPGSPVSPSAPQPFYQVTPPTNNSGFQPKEQHAHKHVSGSSFSSVSSLGTSTTASFSDGTYATPTTTIASPVTPSDDMGLTAPSRPSISKTPKTLRRVRPIRGLSIDTTLSNGSALTSGPPAYQVEDPHPVSPLDSPITPGRVGLAY